MPFPKSRTTWRRLLTSVAVPVLSSTNPSTEMQLSTKHTAILTCAISILLSQSCSLPKRTICHRRRLLPDIHSEDLAKRSRAERQAKNSVIQGSASDLIKKAMIAVQKQLTLGQWRSRLVMQLHDELVIECYESELEHVALMVKNAMENAIHIRVPTPTKVFVGPSLANRTPFELPGDAASGSGSLPTESSLPLSLPLDCLDEYMADDHVQDDGDDGDGDLLATSTTETSNNAAASSSLIAASSSVDEADDDDMVDCLLGLDDHDEDDDDGAQQADEPTVPASHTTSATSAGLASTVVDRSSIYADVIGLGAGLTLGDDDWLAE